MTQFPIAPMQKQSSNKGKQEGSAGKSALEYKVRSYTPWDPAEEEALVRAVIDHGPGAWQTILSDPRYSVLEGRTGIQLKDKWRNMVKTRKVDNPDKFPTFAKNSNAVHRIPRSEPKANRPPKSSRHIGDPAALAIDVPEPQSDLSHGPQSNSSSHTIIGHACEGPEPSQGSYGALHQRWAGMAGPLVGTLQTSPPQDVSGVTDDTAATDVAVDAKPGPCSTMLPQQTLWRPTPVPPSCGLAGFALRSINSLAGAVMSQQRQQAEQRQGTDWRRPSSGLSVLDENVVSAMEIALEAHEIQLEANRQLEAAIGAVERGVPGMRAWMRNAVFVAQLAHDRAVSAWRKLKDTQQQADDLDGASTGKKVVDASMLGFGGKCKHGMCNADEEEEEDYQEEELDTMEKMASSPLPYENSDEEEAAAEALSTLQSGILLCREPSLPHLDDPSLAVEQKNGLPVIIGDDGAFTMLDRPLGGEELQRWANVVQLAARKKRRKRRSPTSPDRDTGRTNNSSPPPAKSNRHH